MQKATKLVVCVSIFFLILFTAFGAFQNIVTRIHEEEGDSSLGPFLLAINYIFFLISGLFVSSCAASEKWQISFSGLAYALNYITGFIVLKTPQQYKYPITAIGAATNGVFSSYLWASMGSYIHKVCHIYNKIEEKGFYYGLFSTLYSLSSIFGALIVTFGLSLLSHELYFILISSIAVLSFFYGAIFIKDLKKIQKKLNYQVSQPREGALKTAIKTLKFYPVMKHALACIFVDGLIIGITSSTILHLLPKQSDKRLSSLHAGFCLISFGIGSCVGGFIGGKLCDYLSIKKSTNITLGLTCIICALSISAWYILELWLAIFCCFVWGYALNSLQACELVFCSRIYGGRTESFAIVKQFHAFSFVLYQIFALLTHNSMPVPYVMTFLLIMTIPAFWGINHLPPEIHVNQSTPTETQSLFQPISPSLLTAEGQ